MSTKHSYMDYQHMIVNTQVHCTCDYLIYYFPTILLKGISLLYGDDTGQYGAQPLRIDKVQVN